jgi:hypothetical protein
MEHERMKPKRRLQTVASPQPQPQIQVTTNKTPDYREGYANSVQVQISVWDFRLSFARTEQSPDELNVNVFQAIDLSPQQAKAVCNLLAQNLAQYERTFGPINLQAARPAEQSEQAPGARPQ